MHIKKQRGFIHIISSILLLGALFFVVLYNIGIKAPNSFPVPYSLTIQSGQTLVSVSKKLSDDGVIRSSRVFEILMIMLGNEKRVGEGEYYFETPLSVIEIVMRISGKQFGIEREKVTFPEGFSNTEIVARLQEKLPSFDVDTFKSLIEGKQGYLFPDTYLFFPSVKPEFVLAALEQNFQKKVAPLAEEIAASGRSLEEILVMASIIEKEAFGKDDRGMISGILWKRIAEGMPLQVDAPFLYLLGKESSQLTRVDLAIDSPYNTYRYKGLPPAPINNPGLASIEAALRPQRSNYLYYLHDATGNIHYASTYKEHQDNITKYLRN